MTLAELMALADESAARHGLAPALVKAVCMVESAWDPWAMRYEPQYRYLVGNQAEMKPTEKVGQMVSWGLMQVMGAVAREYGFTGSFPMLCQPEIGIEHGCLHLKRYHQKYPTNWRDVIASYNAGSPRMDQSGAHYVNQAYVEKVLKHWNNYEVVVPLKETEV